MKEPKPPEQPPEPETPHTRFMKLATGLLQVPKKEIDAKEAAYQRKKQAKAKRKK